MSASKGSTKTYLNSVKIKTNSPVTRSDIAQGLLGCSNNVLDDTKAIVQLKSNSRWLITFKSSSTYNRLLNSSITIKKEVVTLVCANVKPLKTSLLRIMWLPNYSEHQPVKRFLLNQKFQEEDIVKIVNEKCSENNLRNIDNGIVRVVIKDSDINHGYYERACGKQIIDGEKVFIVKTGDDIRCLFCSKLGHRKSGCDDYKYKKSIKCSKCNKTGHLVSDCSYKDIVSNERIEDEENFEYDQEILQEMEKEDNKMTNLGKFSGIKLRAPLNSTSPFSLDSNNSGLPFEQDQRRTQSYKKPRSNSGEFAPIRKKYNSDNSDKSYDSKNTEDEDMNGTQDAFDDLTNSTIVYNDNEDDVF